MEDGSNFCGLLRISELYKITFWTFEKFSDFYFFYSGRPPSDAAERAVAEKRAKLEARVAGRQNHMNNINGVVLTLGQGDTGQLGLGPDIMERSKPALVKDLTRVKAVCAGGMHTVCLTKEGKVYTFGKLAI